MSTWFEGKHEIECSIQQLKQALENHGDFYAGVTRLMPGLTRAELIETGNDFATIKTNEGLMKRTNILKRTEAESVVVECDEEYQAGSKITTKAHFADEFTASGTGVRHRLVISEVSAPGFLGFLYRKFGSNNIGKALLASYKTYLEDEDR